MKRADLRSLAAQLELNNDPRPRMIASSGVAAWEEGAPAANGTLLRQEQKLAHTKNESYTLQQTAEGDRNSGNLFFYQLMTSKTGLSQLQVAPHKPATSLAESQTRLAPSPLKT